MTNNTHRGEALRLISDLAADQTIDCWDDLLGMSPMILSTLIDEYETTPEEVMRAAKWMEQSFIIR